MRQIIKVVEGIDGTGKSTFVTRKAKECNLNIIHIDGRFENTFGAYNDLIVKELIKAKRQSKDGIIFDRAWLGEVPCGVKYRGKPRISIEEIMDLESILSTFYDFEKYFLMNNPQTILEKKIERGEEEIETTIEDIGYMQAQYMNVVLATSIECNPTKILRMY